ncbi:MAG: hypothetical protein RI922_1032, partial [Bacteroidota bacterium]
IFQKEKQNENDEGFVQGKKSDLIWFDNTNIRGTKK